MVKYCKECGFEIDERANFCKECGAKQDSSNSNGFTSFSTKRKLIIIGLVIIIVLMLLSLTAYISYKSESTSIGVSNFNIVSAGYGIYYLSCDIVTDKDYDYLEMMVTYYDSSGAILDKNDYVWSVSNVNKGQNIKVNATTTCNSVPASAEVSIYDTSHYGGEAKPIYTQVINA